MEDTLKGSHVIHWVRDILANYPETTVDELAEIVHRELWVHTTNDEELLDHIRTGVIVWHALKDP